MIPGSTIVTEGGLRPMQELRRYLVDHGVAADVLCPPGKDPGG